MVKDILQLINQAHQDHDIEIKKHSLSLGFNKAD
jgi:hypothetical protein